MACELERALLDTDILSEVLKGKNPAIVGHAVEYAEAFGRFTYTAVTVHVILYGLHYKEAYRQIAQAQVSFAESDVIVPALEDYETAGRIRGVARSQGRQLALDDCLIAAVAARLAVPVVTGNTGHFAAMQQAGLNVRLENWKT